MSHHSYKSRGTLHIIEEKYSLELARGASVIASTLSDASLLNAIDETLSAFCARYGRDDLEAFVLALAERLTQRNRPDAADLVPAWRPST